MFNDEEKEEIKAAHIKVSEFINNVEPRLKILFEMNDRGSFNQVKSAYLLAKETDPKFSLEMLEEKWDEYLKYQEEKKTPPEFIKSLQSFISSRKYSENFSPTKTKIKSLFHPAQLNVRSVYPQKLTREKLEKDDDSRATN